MRTIVINDFSRGMADDRYAGRPGEFGIAKHFDILTNPRRLQPLRGMSSHTASTGIGNLIVASNGLMYGVGTNSGNGRLYRMPGYGLDDFATMATDQLSGATVNYDFLVDWPDCSVTPGTNIRKIFWASNNLLVTSDPAGGSSAATKSLTFSSIGQGFVHPKDKKLYFPYRTTTTPYIGVFSPSDVAIDNGGYTGLNATAFTLPLQYRAYCLTNYGNELAIPMTSTSSLSDVNSSIVGLWSRDTSQTTFTETIPWGAGSLKVLNNLQGALVGISERGSDTVQAETTQDYNSILIKVWNGGSEPTLIKEIKAFHLAGSSRPSVSINPRVNFINSDRLYFSVNVNPNDGVSPAYYGLWSVGRNKLTGEWAVNLERMATNTNTETSVIAAAIAGDYVEMVHTAAGTLTKSTNGQTSSSTYGATSVYETVVNPDMPEVDRLMDKKLHNITVHTLPIPTSGQVVLKYRVDSDGDNNDWVTVRTHTTAGSVHFEAPKPASGFYTDGRNFEFRIESTGGAVITALSYRYEPKISLQ